jgi:putative sugar O-methyltransferase
LSLGEKSRDVLNETYDSVIGTRQFISFDNKKVTRKYLQHVISLSILGHYTNINRIKSVLEIGGGYGGFCELFHKYHQLDYYILIDIAPILYVSTQYLKACFPGKVIDFREAKQMDTISANQLENKILAIPPWMLKEIKVPIDLVWNSASFQEMEKDVVINYLSFVCRLTGAIFICSLLDGQEVRDGRQKEAITFDWIRQKITDFGFKEKHNPFTMEKGLLRVELPGYETGYYER